MKNQNFQHGGNIYEIKGRYDKDVLDFSSNINPLGIPPKILNTLYKNYRHIFYYPDSEAGKLSEKIAQYWKIRQENVLIGNGSIELIYLIMHCYKPRVVLIPSPSFSEYERAAKTVNSKIRFLKLKESDGFKLNSSGAKRADIVFLCNPNNPTGNLMFENYKAIHKLADKMAVIDEAFMDFLPDQKEYTLIWEATKSKNLTVIRTFTKFFAMPGLRLGYLIAHKDIIDRLKAFQPPWNTNALAQLAGELILDYKEYTRNTYKVIEKEKGFLFDEISKINGLKPYPSVANFLLVKIECDRFTSLSLKDRLIKKGILIRDCSNFRNLSDKFIRVAVKSRQENKQLIKALKEALNG